MTIENLIRWNDENMDEMKSLFFFLFFERKVFCGKLEPEVEIQKGDGKRPVN